MGDFPLSVLFVFPALVVTIPAIVLALLFGGRGVVIGLVFVLIVMSGHLYWDFVLVGNEFTTGMEGIVLFLFPFWWCVGAVWSLIIYLSIMLLGWLPKQRRRSKT